MSFNLDPISYSSYAIGFPTGHGDGHGDGPISDPRERAEGLSIFDTMTSILDDSIPDQNISDLPEEDPDKRDTEKPSIEFRDPTFNNRLDSRLNDPVAPIEAEASPSYYIQAAQHNHRAFLTTNLSGVDAAQVTALSSTWLIGRSRNCAIVVHDRSVSRCHAVVGYDVQQGFYLMDVGSSNGSYLNQKKLSVLKRYSLKDGDVIMLCNLQFEFFIAG